MNVISKIVIASLSALISFNNLTATAMGSPNPRTECPNPFPSDYKAPTETKSVKIPQLGITVRVPEDNRLVYVNVEKVKRFTFMTPLEYKSYQCSIAKKIDYLSFYPSIYYVLSYEIIRNPQKKPLFKFVKENLYKGFEGSVDNFEQLKINNIEFLTTPKSQFDPVNAWFIPKSKPDIVVQYTYMCEACNGGFNGLKEDLSDIRNISD
jgi:hypothetical protein